MRKIIYLIAVITATTLTTYAFTTLANFNASVNIEVSGDEYVEVEFKDLPTETQEALLGEFAGYEFKSISQNVETKLLKVVVVKEGEEEKTFIQNEEGKFIEQ